jgi:hypothetical protein
VALKRLKSLEILLGATPNRFNVRFNDGRILVYRRPGEPYTDATIMEHDHFGGGVCDGKGGNNI